MEGKSLSTRMKKKNRCWHQGWIRLYKFINEIIYIQIHQWHNNINEQQKEDEGYYRTILLSYNSDEVKWIFNLFVLMKNFIMEIKNCLKNQFLFVFFEYELHHGNK